MTDESIKLVIRISISISVSGALMTCSNARRNSSWLEKSKSPSNPSWATLPVRAMVAGIALSFLVDTNRFTTDPGFRLIVAGLRIVILSQICSMKVFEKHRAVLIVYPF